MSKVRNALRVAGAWPQQGEESPQPQLVFETKTPAAVIEPPEEIEPLEEQAARPSILTRIVRRFRRWMGLRTSGPVPRCSSVTRRGLPCRAPAMSNGLCRMHGGTNDSRVSMLLSRLAKPQN